jgi:hypothetical protein
MNKGFDNFNAVDSQSKQNNVINDEYLNVGGFLGNIFTTQTGTPRQTPTIISQLPQKYKDALVQTNLEFRLNLQQRQDLNDALIAISNDNTLSGAQKISNAIFAIENVMQYLKNPVVTMVRNNPMTNSNQSLANTTNETIETKSANDIEEPKLDIVKISLIVLAIGIIGYMGYVTIKK